MKKILLVLYVSFLAVFIAGCGKEDKEAPTVKLLGDSVVEIYKGETFDDPGCEVSDNVDKNLECIIANTHNYDNRIIGTHEFHYYGIDKSGNKSDIVKRTIKVVSRTGMYHEKTLKSVDISDEYTLPSKTLKAYSYDSSDLSYVNIEEFMTFMDEVLSDKVSVDISSGDEGETLRVLHDDLSGHYIEFDATNNYINITDIDFMDHMNVETETDFVSGIVTISTEETGEFTDTKIKLSDYNINIHKIDEGYYIPLYLANMFLTGAYTSVYELDNEIYFMDYWTEFDSLKGKFGTVQTAVLSDELKQSTIDFYALSFDHFYGLKDYHEVDTFYDVLDGYNIKEAKTYNDFYTKIQNYLYDLGDLHTAPWTYGNNGASFFLYPPQITDNSTKISKYYRAASVYDAFDIASEMDFKVIDDNTVVIQINAFSADTQKLIKECMEKATPYENVIIDVSVNGGGMLAGVIHVLKYMTNDPIAISFHNYGTNMTYTETLKGDGDFYTGQNFYVTTSNLTFSAANLFTSIVKDMKLGTVVGQNSLGGACSITPITSPDGTILQISSNTCYLNQAGELVEEGIAPDYYLPLTFNDPKQANYDKVLELI